MKYQHLVLASAVWALTLCGQAAAEVKEVRIVKQFGLGFLPLMMMEDRKLVEKHAQAAGLGDVKGTYLTLSSPSAMNDGLLSGQVDVGTNGPPSVLTIWSRTKGTANEIKAMASMITSPMWLNVNREGIRSIKDFTEKDKIALTSVKVSIPAVILQMAAAKEWGKENATKLDPLTVSMSHPDAFAAFSSKRDITAHFTSPPYIYREAALPGVRTILNSDDVMGGQTTFSMIYSSSKFHDANPKTYKAVLSAFTEAIELINKDKKAAAEVFLRISGDKKSTLAEIQNQLEDKNIVFSTRPYNIMKYAEFMFESGSIKNKPTSWKDVFFSAIHDQTGS